MEGKSEEDEFSKQIELIPYQKLKDMFPHSNHRVKGMMIEKILQLPFTLELIKQVSDGTFRYPKIPAYESLKLSEMKAEWKRISPQNENEGKDMRKKDLFHKLFFEYKDVYVHPIPRWRLPNITLAINALETIGIIIVKKEEGKTQSKRQIDKIYDLYYHVFNKTKVRFIQGEQSVKIYPTEVFTLLGANLIQIASEDNLSDSDLKRTVEQNLAILNNLVKHFSFQYQLEWQEDAIPHAEIPVNLILVSPLVYTERELKEIEDKLSIKSHKTYMDRILHINSQIRVFLPMGTLAMPGKEKEERIAFNSSSVHVYFKIDELTSQFKNKVTFLFCIVGIEYPMICYIDHLINILEKINLSNGRLMYDIRRIQASMDLHSFILKKRRANLTEEDKFTFKELLYKDADLSPLCSEDLDKKEKYIEIYSEQKDKDKTSLMTSLQKYIVKPLANITLKFIFKDITLKDICV